MKKKKDQSVWVVEMKFFIRRFMQHLFLVFKGRKEEDYKESRDRGDELW